MNQKLLILATLLFIIIYVLSSFEQGEEIELLFDETHTSPVSHPEIENPKPAKQNHSASESNLQLNELELLKGTEEKNSRQQIKSSSVKDNAIVTKAVSERELRREFNSRFKSYSEEVFLRNKIYSAFKEQKTQDWDYEAEDTLVQ